MNFSSLLYSVWRWFGCRRKVALVMNQCLLIFFHSAWGSFGCICFCTNWNISAGRMSSQMMTGWWHVPVLMLLYECGRFQPDVVYRNVMKRHYAEVEFKNGSWYKSKSVPPHQPFSGSVAQITYYHQMRLFMMAVNSLQVVRFSISPQWTGGLRFHHPWSQQW